MNIVFPGSSKTKAATGKGGTRAVYGVWDRVTGAGGPLAFHLRLFRMTTHAGERYQLYAETPVFEG